MTRVHYVNFVTDLYGVGVTGAVATVGPRNLATPCLVYVNSTGSTLLSTPLLTVNGKTEFWIDEGAYNIAFTGTGGFQDFTHYFEAVSAESMARVLGQSKSTAITGAGTTTTSGTPSTSTQLVPSQPSRVEIAIYNLSSTANVYLGRGVTAALNAGDVLYPGGPPIVLDITYTGAINMICSIASQTIAYTVT